MSITIYTYRDPYALKDEPFWNEIINCPYYCVSQTLVNGLRTIYGDDAFRCGIATIKNLVDHVFAEWQSPNCGIKQNAIIDNVIADTMALHVGDSRIENLGTTFFRNREEVFNAVRVLCELNVKVDDVRFELLTPEQRFAVEIYSIIIKSEHRSRFIVKSDLHEAEMNQALVDSMRREEGGSSRLERATDTVVFHGVHQFSPIMLRAIEELSRFKKVILLFNYQSQYKEVYQTWINVYSAFDQPISSFSGPEFRPTKDLGTSFEGNVLADELGSVARGDFSSICHEGNYEIIEFDNMTEFAGYVASIYDDARKVNPENPLSVMKEQFYAADSTANDLLKVYFPEQFGERQFLNYPLGHFFLAIAKMWDPSGNRMIVEDICDVKECLSAGILEEGFPGELASIFGASHSLFEGCSSIEEMLSRVKKARKAQKRIGPEYKDQLMRIAYYRIAADDLRKLQEAFESLIEIAQYFYEDFESHSDNFKMFYRKLTSFLREEILEGRDLDAEFEDIVRRVLIRLEEIRDVDATASFECLKSTMSLYLTQEPKPGASANWIVRNFEQIDGDILRSKGKKVGNTSVVYHFACLSDEDVNAVGINPFPWPLDEDFFVLAQDPVDWKYQVYVRSKNEYCNFKHYALVFGLEFNRADYKLSYVKHDAQREKSPCSRLMMLGALIKPFNTHFFGGRLDELPTIEIGVEQTKENEFQEVDLFRYRICKYRFLLESLIEKETVYKDSFLLTKYMESVIENSARKSLVGWPLSETVITNQVEEAFLNLERYFPFMRNAGKVDVVNNLRRGMAASRERKFPSVDEDEQRKMSIREHFIKVHISGNGSSDVFKAAGDGEVSEVLNEEVLKNVAFAARDNGWCAYCANREICADCFASEAMEEL